MTADAVLERMRDLPALPQAVLELQAALGRDDVSFDRLADAISHDQALAAKTLRLANSSFYGLPGRVASIRDAIAVLGLRQVGMALTAAAVSGAFAGVQCPGFDMTAYWRHSVACGICTRLIGDELRLDGGAAFTAGLLHDIGRLALAARAPDALAEALAHRRRDDGLIWQSEREVLGIDHMEIGAKVAERWHFGHDIIDAIRLHHAPPADAGRPVADAVHVANAIVHALDVAGDADDMVPPVSAPVWNRLGLTAEQCARVFEGTEAALNEVCAALGVVGG